MPRRVALEEGETEFGIRQKGMFENAGVSAAAAAHIFNERPGLQ